MFNNRTPIEDRFKFRTNGIFRCSYPAERLWIIISVAVGLIVWLACYDILGEQFKYIYHIHESTEHSLFFSLAISLFTFIIIILEMIVIKRILSGIEYHYSADDTMFIFYSQKAGTSKTEIHYNDILSINYEQSIIFGVIDRGYIVSIETRTLGTKTFNYLYNKSASKSRESTPFYIIEQRIEIQNEIHGRK